VWSRAMFSREGGGGTGELDKDGGSDSCREGGFEHTGDSSKGKKLKRGTGRGWIGMLYGRRGGGGGGTQGSIAEERGDGGLGGLVTEMLGGGVDGGESGGREERGSVLGLCTTEGVGADLGCNVEVSALISGTRPTGTVLRKCVRGTPRQLKSGRSGSW
jgi:hypothetical protein